MVICILIASEWGSEWKVESIASAEFLPILLNSCSPLHGSRPADGAAFHPQILSAVKKNVFESHLHVLLIVISITWPFQRLGLEFEWLADFHLPVTECLNCPVCMFCWRAKAAMDWGWSTAYRGLSLAILQVASTTVHPLDFPRNVRITACL